MQSDVGTPKEEKLAIQVSTLRRSIKPKLPHAEARLKRVPACAGFDDVEKGIIRRPEPSIRDADSLRLRGPLTGLKPELLAGSPGDFALAFPRPHTMRQSEIHRLFCIVHANDLHEDF